MALVLPMSGVQQYFCTMGMVFVEGVNHCPVEAEDCCGKDFKEEPKAPDCMVASKPIPDADKPASNIIPGFDLESPVLELPLAVSEPLPDAADVLSSPLRGPPDPERLFLVQERLLI